MLPFHGSVKTALDFSYSTFSSIFVGSARCRDMVINPTPTHILAELRIFPNLGLKAIKGEYFRNTKVIDTVIKCFYKTVPPSIKLGLASRESNFMLIYLTTGVSMKIFHISIKYISCKSPLWAL